MRLSGLSAVAVLLFASTFTSTLFAQHTASTSSAPPPAPSPVVSTPAPPPAPPPPAPTMTSSGSSSASTSHASAPSPSPTPASVPESHVSASSSSAVSHPSVAPSPSTVSAAGSSPASRISAPEAHRLVSEEKINGTERIVGVPRVGDQSQKELEAKPADPDLRRRVCVNGDCKEPVVKPAPESDLRRRVCLSGECGCAPGQVAGKGGCVAPAAETRAQQCQIGATWNGASCVQSTRECSGITAQAAALAAELRSIKAQTQAACTNDPYGPECNDAKQRLEEARMRYRMLLNGAPAECRSTLADPSLF
jgi:hypothetical protein